MNRLIFFIKTSLFACVVIASQTYASDTNININTNINSTAWRSDNIGGFLDEYGPTPPEAMIKIQKVEMTITNNTGFELTGPVAWFDSGRLGDGMEWPSSIDAYGGQAKVELYEKDGAVFAGCSGYVNYFWGGKGIITFAFSNPFIGSNKVGVGVGGKSVWDNMDDHGYKEFTVKFKVNDLKLKAVCSCTGGDINNVKIDLYNDTE
ncbi:MAG: hypothetical protein LPH21_12230 [Shewanella sp.]|nr:hypothetical protein [Shewanella sp.]